MKHKWELILYEVGVIFFNIGILVFIKLDAFIPALIGIPALIFSYYKIHQLLKKSRGSEDED